MRTFGALAAVLSVLAVPQPAPARAAQQHGCSQVGCISSVMVDASTVPARARDWSTVTFCVGRGCEKVEHIRRSSEQLQRTLSRQRRAEIKQVRLVFRDAHGRVLLRTKGRAVLEAYKPNDETCPPVCWIARLEYRGTRLVSAKV